MELIEFEEKPKAKKKRPKPKLQPGDYEYEKRLEKRRQQYEAFATVVLCFKEIATIRTNLANAGFTFEEIENGLNVLRAAKSYMNSRTK